MKLLVAPVFLLLFTLIYCPNQTSNNSSDGNIQASSHLQGRDDDRYTYSEGFTFKNLSVYFIRGKDEINSENMITLQEAMERKIVKVYETEQVNELSIENTSDKYKVYVHSGEIVKGGKQDRVFERDLVLEPKSGKTPVSSFCVEQGRWQKRGNEDLHHFASSNDMISTKEMKMAVKGEREQTAVWHNVEKTQNKLSQSLGKSVNSGESASSLQLSLEDEDLNKEKESYISFFSKLIDKFNDSLGYAFAINGEVNSGDIYGSHDLFKKLWEKLIEATVVEAIADFNKDKTFAAPKKEEIRDLILLSQKGDYKDSTVSNNVMLNQKENDDYMVFEAVDNKSKNKTYHKNFIKK